MMTSKCQTCGKTYINSHVSPWCKECNEEMNSWVDPQSQSNVEKPTIEKKRSDFGEKIQGLGLKFPNEEKLTTPQMPKDTEKLTAPDTMPIKNNEMHSVQPGHEKIRSDSLNTKELTTVKTPNTLERSSMNQETNVIPLEDFTAKSQNLITEASQSINLLSLSENELFNSMKGLRHSQPDTAVKLYDPDRVQTAVLCGRQIAESMKTKLELMKFIKDFSRATK